MNNESRPKVENLEVNRETLQDLTEQEGEQAKGGGFTVAAAGCGTVAQALTRNYGTCTCNDAG